MDRITELLAGLPPFAEMDDEQIAEALATLVEAFDEAAAGDVSTELAEVLAQAADTIDEIRTEITAREAAAAELAARVNELALRVHGPEDDDEDGDGDGDGDAPAEPEVVVEAAAETEPEPVVEPEPELEPVLAAAPAPAPARQPVARARQFVPAAARRVPAQAGPRARLVAAPDLAQRAAGSEFGSWREAADATLERIRAFGSSRGPGEGQMIRVGSLIYDGYGDRVITPQMTADQVDSLVASLTLNEQGESLVASGGLCAPTDVRYDLATISQADRPLRSGLPTFQATRGGIQFNSPSILSDVVVDNTDGAIDTITVANDASAVTKTVQEALCGSAQEVTVDAITERVKFSNFTDRYNPERMEQWLALARAAHSRRCEQKLLGLINSGSTVVNAGVVDLGAARQVVANLMVVASRYRVRHRMTEDATMRVILPLWLGDVIATDLLFQMPGDGTINGVQGRAWITARLGDANIVPIWQRDDLDNTGMAAAVSAGTHPDYPQGFRSFMFHEGAWLHLDGGQLDFGIVRDSTLNAANRFETFFEVFESVAFVGVESLAIQHSIVASGVSGAGVTSAGGAIGS